MTRLASVARSCSARRAPASRQLAASLTPATRLVAPSPLATRASTPRATAATLPYRAAAAFSTTATRPYAHEEPLNQEIELPDVERVQDECDVCIVGGGPAGLSAAIQLMKMAKEKGEEIRVVVLEKGAEVGASSLPVLLHVLARLCTSDSALTSRLLTWENTRLSHARTHALQAPTSCPAP